MDEILKKNLANVQVSLDLFGNEVKKLSMRDRIGFLPISIWRPDWNVVKKLKAIIGDDGSTRIALDGSNEGGGVYRKPSKSKLTYMSSLGNSETNVSIFNPHLAQMILSAYCPEGARVFDPFGGGGTRGFIASAMGYGYFGIELRQDEVDRIKSQQRTLGNDFDIVCGDSTVYPVEEDAFDFSYTCPPYYDLEIYSDLKDDLSAFGTYDDFLVGIKASLEATYRALRPGSMAVWVVGNFRDKKGDLRHFNGDVARLGKEVGFHLHDELIFWGASGVAASRSGQFECNRKSVRVHEYLVIFRK